jgi:uncharacterized protein
MDIKIVKIEKPEDMNFILGQSHFIKTVEDIHEIIVQTAPFMKFGLAFCEASGPCLVRYSGNDESLIEIAKKNAYNISAGHSFIVFMENGFPVNILNSIKSLPVVCRIFCATSNLTQIIIAESEGGRGILGVIDGEKSKGIESQNDIQTRQAFLRKIGYKF